MKANTLSRLVEISYLDEAARESLLDQAHQRDVGDYLHALDSLGRLDVPRPATLKKWAGRVQLLDAIDADRSKAPRPRQPLRWLGELRIPAAGLTVGTLLLASATIGGSVGAFSGSGGTFSEVLSALGLSPPPETSEPSASPGFNSAIPAFTPEKQIGVPGEARNGESSPSLDVPDEPGVPASATKEAGVPGVLPPQYPFTPPGQSGENPGQGGNPPGQSGENRGQGGNPPGQSGENPGQGADPPGQSGENRGQGGNPPGQSGENPGQGVDPPVQSGENPGNLPDQGQGQGSGQSH
jgi:hypothetical protein